MILDGKTVVLGVTGGIAAYKSAELVRSLVKQDAQVHVIMTENANHFITPLTLQTLSQNTVHSDPFRLIEQSEIGHIALADKADVVVVAPATANVMGKTANGIADDLLTTTIMATKAPILFAPSMNVNMWENPAMKGNLEKLLAMGYHTVGPESGELACKVHGTGRLAEINDIIFAIEDLLSPKPLKGKRIVITAGPTRENLDPVRYISNRSSGKMGFALARAARLLGAKVTLVTGPTSIEPFSHVERLIRVETAEELLDAAREAFAHSDVLVMCAAVADFRPKYPEKEKGEKASFAGGLELEPTPDIAKILGQEKGGRIVIGFAAETKSLKKKAQRKLREKNLDFIVANDVSRRDIGFDSDLNEVRIIGADGSEKTLPKKPKEELAFDILAHTLKQ